MKAFFSYLNDQDQQRAYSLLATTFQAHHPYDEWEAGYRNILNYNIESVSCTDESCAVEFIATENDKIGLRRQRYTLRYSLVDNGDGFFQIDSGLFLASETVEVIKKYEPVVTTDQSNIIPSVIENICSADDTYSEPLSTGLGTVIRSSGIV